MAKQAMAFALEGTIGNVTYYKSQGKYYAKIKSSLTRERVLTDPAFKKTIETNKQFHKASKVATKIYWMLPERKRKMFVIAKVIGKVNVMMKEDASLETIVTTILVNFGSITFKTAKDQVEHMKKDNTDLFSFFQPPYKDLNTDKLIALLSGLKTETP